MQVLRYLREEEDDEDGATSLFLGKKTETKVSKIMLHLVRYSLAIIVSIIETPFIYLFGFKIVSRDFFWFYYLFAGAFKISHSTD